MSDPKMNGAAEAGKTTPLGAMFDLSPEDVGRLEEFCGGALQEIGVDGRQFFDRLQRGETVGAALGLPAGVSELIYARAHRWFIVDRPDRAEPLFRALCVADGKVADYWIGLGVCLRLRRDMTGAALAFAMAARLRPEWAVPAFHAAELAMNAQDLAGAARNIRRFHELADAAIPQRMSSEIARMEKALEVRRALSGPPGPKA